MRKFREVLNQEGYRLLCRFLDERDGGCVLCGSPYVEHHHVIPRSLGGDDRADNMVCLCHWHHAQYDKDKKMRHEFLQYLRTKEDYHRERAEELERIYRRAKK